MGGVTAGASSLANADVGTDNVTGTEADLKHPGQAADAARRFPENGAESAAETHGVVAEAA